jgi:hypothetical protein
MQRDRREEANSHLTQFVLPKITVHIKCFLIDTLFKNREKEYWTLYCTLPLKYGILGLWTPNWEDRVQYLRETSIPLLNNLWRYRYVPRHGNERRRRMVVFECRRLWYGLRGSACRYLTNCLKIYEIFVSISNNLVSVYASI